MWTDIELKVTLTVVYVCAGNYIGVDNDRLCNLVIHIHPCLKVRINGKGEKSHWENEPMAEVVLAALTALLLFTTYILHYSLCFISSYPGRCPLSPFPQSPPPPPRQSLVLLHYLQQSKHVLPLLKTTLWKLPYPSWQH
jgi:hypothetical protein